MVATAAAREGSTSRVRASAPDAGADAGRAGTCVPRSCCCWPRSPATAISPGSTYPALAQLEDEGLVVATAVGTGREFALTDAGRAHVEENREALGEPWTEATQGFPKEGIELRGLIKQVAIAAAQVMAAGTQAQREEAVKLLAETRRGLYRLLAQEDEQE